MQIELIYNFAFFFTQTYLADFPAIFCTYFSDIKRFQYRAEKTSCQEKSLKVNENPGNRFRKFTSNGCMLERKIILYSI